MSFLSGVQAEEPIAKKKPDVKSEQLGSDQTEEKQEQVSSDDIELPPLNLKTILLNKSTREKIDQQRMSYLNPQEIEEIEVPEVVEPVKKPVKPKKKPIVLPAKLSVRGVVKKSDGSYMVLINDKFNTTQSKYVMIDYSLTNSKGVMFSVLGKQKFVPVGSTLIPRTMAIKPNYEVVREQNRKQLQTKDKATETTLKDVLKITGE